MNAKIQFKKSSFLHKNKKKYLSKIYNNYYINIIKYHNMREMLQNLIYRRRGGNRKAETRGLK